MHTINRYLILFVTMASASLAFGQHGHGMGPKPGKYFGYVKPEGFNVKLPASLDLVVVQNDAEYAQLRGVFKVMLGGFQSFEYVTQYYEKVSYSWVRQELTFESDQRELVLSNGKVHMMNMKLMVMGDFRSSAGGVTGRVNLIHFPEDENASPEMLASKIFPDTPVLTSLTGSYKGSCEEEDYELQIEASKWHGSSGFSTNPLVGYMIQGRLGKRGNQACPEDRYCIERPFTEGSYNFYRGELELTGRLRNLRCSVNNTKIQCGPCAFQKTTLANSVDKDKTRKNFEREVHLDLGENGLLPDFPEPSDLKGDYFGLLHHEATDSYQHLRVNVNALKYSDRPNRPEILYVSANAWLYFDKPSESNEFIGYKFDQRPYLDTAPNFLFEGGGDAFFRVTSWSTTAMVGEWYSKAFGRVGTVQLVREGGFVSVDDRLLLPKFGGRYLGPNWEFDITVRGNSDNFNEGGFYPLRVAGVGRIPGLTAAHPISAGNWDFYTNTVSVALEGQRIGLGRLSHDGLLLFWPGRQSWGIQMGEHRLDLYETLDNNGWH